ncbi:WAT1-related protein At3g30340-like [Malania oleifera]|uniref:WAT1-related protein At3g30340-like n=1 Tax=Malania oleifera TaxID=397392 RepID=UPI0025AE7419|nr:WAT1-related protein At3g30340-like [Malania oleifera]
MKKGGCEARNPVIAMVAIDFGLALVNVLLKKVLDEGMNHLVLITYRLTISSILLAPIGYFWERNSRPKLTLRILCFLFFSAIIGASLTQYFFLIGIQYTSATFSCAFINMVPVFTFLMALPFRLERVDMRGKSGRAKVVGTVVCVGGAMLLTLYKGMPLVKGNSTNSAILHHEKQSLKNNNKSERWMIGTVALIAGTLLWSSWFLVQSNIGHTFPCQYSSTAFMSFFGALQSAVLTFSIHGSNLSLWALKSKLQIVTVLYAGSIGSGLCYVGISWCVKKRGPVFTAAFSPLVQIMAAMFDIPFLHEQLNLGSLLGSLIVIVGLSILLWGKYKEAQNNCTGAKGAQGTDQEAAKLDQDPQLQLI